MTQESAEEPQKTVLRTQRGIHWKQGDACLETCDALLSEVRSWEASSTSKWSRLIMKLTHKSHRAFHQQVVSKRCCRKAEPSRCSSYGACDALPMWWCKSVVPMCSWKLWEDSLIPGHWCPNVSFFPLDWSGSIYLIRVLKGKKLREGKEMAQTVKCGPPRHKLLHAVS